MGQLTCESLLILFIEPGSGYIFKEGFVTESSSNNI